jgi:hypothetical protein
MTGREFHPSSFIHPCGCPRSSGVERLLGKEEVMSSNLIAGSILKVCDLLSQIVRNEQA